MSLKKYPFPSNVHTDNEIWGNRLGGAGGGEARGGGRAAWAGRDLLPQVHPHPYFTLAKQTYLQKVNTLAVTAFKQRSKKQVPGHRNKN